MSNCKPFPIKSLRAALADEDGVIHCPREDCSGDIRYTEHIPVTMDAYISPDTSEGLMVVVDSSTYKDISDGNGTMPRLECDECFHQWTFPKSATYDFVPGESFREMKEALDAEA